MSDASLRWYPIYRKGELVVCSERGGGTFRFGAYLDKERTRATLLDMVLGDLPGEVPVSSLSRPSIKPADGHQPPPGSDSSAFDAAVRAAKEKMKNSRN